jgi:hypothetical protein
MAQRCRPGAHASLLTPARIDDFWESPPNINKLLMKLSSGALIHPIKRGWIRMPFVTPTRLTWLQDLFMVFNHFGDRLNTLNHIISHHSITNPKNDRPITN